MLLEVGCPRCAAPVAPLAAGVVESSPEGLDGAEGGVSCPEHGVVTPLHRPAEASYDAFAEHLTVSTGVPTYLPWPLGPGWTVTDFASVARTADTAEASLTCCSGTSALDGPVDVVVVSERPGVGLGARCAGLDDVDPGPALGEGPPTTRVRLEGRSVQLWPVSTSDTAAEWDRSVLVGEDDGRWLWLVVRPASALLLLRDDWILRDVSVIGPALVELAFGGPGRAW